ncbi:pseudouridine synthase [Vandammella animalimorsus]|uniref:pseudouridine synthase n=1 Tax=Vandammella animalimorsus TaxID=2029117 RepID=UPI0031BB95DE
MSVRGTPGTRRRRRVQAPWAAGAQWCCVGVPAAARGQSALEFLCQRFVHIERQEWLRRFAQAQVRDVQGQPLQPAQPLAGNGHIYYQRAVDDELPVPFEVSVLHADADLLVVDKPHFLTVAPAGRHVQQTVLQRLREQLAQQAPAQAAALAPLHRLDKDTAGLLLLSVNPASRDAYHGLFRDQGMDKEYEAVARWDARFAAAEPYCHRSRLEPGGARFFTMQEVPGEPNSQTLLHIVARAGDWALYRLRPLGGRKHQLRVHMAALGVPIRNDAFYPCIDDPPPGDFSRPLQLLARTLRFTDPISGQPRCFHSQRSLQWPPPER